jgi:uncharacterized membrane protein YtjA (UPF0391 family)
MVGRRFLAIAKQAVTGRDSSTHDVSAAKESRTHSPPERKGWIVVDPAGSTGALGMFKYAVIFLIISLLAGALGLTNVSRIAKRISLVLFALFFLIFLALIGFAYLVGEAIDHSALVPAAVMVSV